jgi:hypothetical protein
MREAEKPWHEELDFQTLAAQEAWGAPGLSARLRALLRARHLRRTADQDVFLFEWDRQEDAEIAALHASDL